MPVEVYRKLLKGQAAQIADTDWDQTLGGLVMKEARVKGWIPKSHMAEITAEFYRGLINICHWTWTPGAMCKGADAPLDAATLLDGVNVAKECKAPAEAFNLLLKTPLPYGFGLTETEVKPFAGREAISLLRTMAKPYPYGDDPTNPPETALFRQFDAGAGFYSYHPADGIHGLKPNVYDPATRKLTSLYSWRDHKVVLAFGQYWDVCYNRRYTKLEKMACAYPIAENRQVLPKGKPVPPSVKKELKVFVLKWASVVYFHEVEAGTAADNAGAAEEGPFGKSILGDEDANVNVGTPSDWGTYTEAEQAANNKD